MVVSLACPSSILPEVVIVPADKLLIVPREVIFVCAAVCNVPASCVAVNLPVLGLYVKSPSLSNPMLPPSTSPPEVNMMALSSSVLSLSVIVTVVATVAVLAVPVTLPVTLPSKFATNVPAA